VRVYLDDTVVLDADLGRDLTGATVEVIVAGSTAMSGAATIADETAGTIHYEVEAGEAGVFQVRYRITSDVVATVIGPTLRVTDPAGVWCDVGDVEAIAGPQEDAEAVMVAIDTAMVLIMSWLCVAPGEPLPPQFTAATAIVAAGLLQAPAPGSPVSETIGDYSYRLATGPDHAGLRGEVRALLSPWLCGNIHSPRVWPDPSLAYIYDPLGEYQVDAEGLLRS
jgi:hypothetical protein